MSALPGCTISDTYGALVPSGAIAALSGLIRAQASVTPLFVQQSDGTWLEHADVVVSTRAASGLWTLVLPSQPTCDPAGVTWTITLPDGTAWNGAVTAAMVTASQSAPLTLHQLVTTYGWAATSVVSPSADATTLKTGAVLIDVEPLGGHPVALTAPRLGAPDGIATLDGAGHVPLTQIQVPFAEARMSGIQTIAPVTSTALVFDVTGEDQGTTTAQHSTTVNPTHLTCVTAGIYQISAGAVFDDQILDLNTEPERQLWIVKNGTVTLTQTTIQPLKQDLTCLAVSTTVPLLVGDYVEVFVWHNARDASGPVSRNIDAQWSFPAYLTWVRLG